MDDEYKRCGTANIFLCVEPLKGKTVVEATEHRAKVDFAHFIGDLCDGPYRDAEKLVVVMDNLNTHSIASLYEAFPPAEALRLAEKLDVLGNIDGVIAEIVRHLEEKRGKRETKSP